MGIVVQDAHNSLVGNRVINIRKGPGIQIMCGDARYNEVRQGSHPQAYDTRLDGAVARSGSAGGTRATSIRP